MKCNNKTCQATFISPWLNQQSKYGKVRGLGYSHEEARQIVSLCPKCFKDWLKNARNK